MEEAVVEAVVFTALIAIATVLGAYFTLSASFLAENIHETNGLLTKMEILNNVIDACRYAYTEGLPQGYNTVSFSISTDRRLVVVPTANALLINPSDRGAQTNVTVDDLSWACSTGAGRQITVSVESGDAVRGSVVTFTLTIDTGTNTATLRVSAP